MTDPIRPLRGELVYLRPLEPADAELVHGWYADARMSSWMGDLPRSLTKRRRYYETLVDSEAEEQFCFIICGLDDDQAVGRADVFELDRHAGSAAFGLGIGDPARWGQGLGTDAVNAVVDFAFGQLRLERLWLGTDSRNERAQASYRKAGFTEEGRLRHAYFQDGRFLDEVRMSMLRAEWAALTRPRSWQLVDDAIRAAGGVGDTPSP